jgi:hypothetical protein
VVAEYNGWTEVVLEQLTTYSSRFKTESLGDRLTFLPSCADREKEALIPYYSIIIKSFGAINY